MGVARDCHQPADDFAFCGFITFLDCNHDVCYTEIMSHFAVWSYLVLHGFLFKGPGLCRGCASMTTLSVGHPS